MRNDGEILVGLDVEGPQVLNDSAFETTVELAKLCGLGEEIGREFFRRVSNIDDIWGIFHKIPQDPSYSPGHTLKVILPFFVAMGATKKELYQIARENLRIVPNIKDVLAALQKKYEVWMISTSYDWFIRAYCDYVNFPFGHTYCTKVEGYDQTPIAKKQRELLLRFMENVANSMPVIEYDHKTGEIVPDHQEYYDTITKFIWETVYNMPLGELLRNVHPIGQVQKTEALKEIRRKTGFPKRKIMYIGDSITDEGVVKWLKGVGLTMAFNGKGRVCDLSDLMYIGESAIAILQVAENFAEHGRDTTLNYYSAPQNTSGGVITAVTRKNIRELKMQSEKMRKEFRGEHIGALT